MSQIVVHERSEGLFLVYATGYYKSSPVSKGMGFFEDERDVFLHDRRQWVRLGVGKG